MRLSLNLCDRLSADETDRIVLQTPLVSHQTTAAFPLFHHCNSKTRLRQLMGHNQSQIAAAQNHSRPFRDKSMQIQLQAIQQSNVALGALSGSVGELGSKLQTSLNALGNEQALTNALLDKVATSSDALVNDLNYVMGYKAPYYLKK